MNNYLVQGYVQSITSGNFNDYLKGGIFLYSGTITNQPSGKGVLEVIPNGSVVVQRATDIGSSTSQVSGAQYLRSGAISGNSITWSNWITVSSAGGTITIVDTVTQGSTDAVTGGGIYDFVMGQIQAPHDPYTELYISQTDGVLTAAPRLDFKGWTNAVPSTVAGLIADSDFKTCLRNVVHIYINNTFWGQGLLISPDGFSTTNEAAVYFPQTLEIGSYNYDGVCGKLTYTNSNWYLGGNTSGNTSTFIAPIWAAAIQEATTYSNANGTTVAVGGIPAGTTFSNKPLKEIFEDMFYPYVAFTFSSFTTTAASGTFEYGTAKSITAVKPTYTKGSKNLTNMKVGTTSGGSNLYNSSVPNSGTSISLSTPLQLNGLSNQTIYTTITDGTTTTTRSVTFSFPYYYYWANTNSTTTPGSLSATNVIRGGSDADGDVSGVQTDNNSYLFFFVPSGQNKSQIQQYAMSQWNNVDTISMGTVTFLTSTNQSVTTYKAYRTSMLVAGSGNRFRIN